ncbi:hypothetical protein CO151_08530 [bacterium CG_4_9_14_3_um_filter_65_15]|nr:MAG: hypothetical protein CO151_08530 [bacterium CG_4_9_14_3_um_filter_65_15]
MDATTPFQVGIKAIDSGKMLARKALQGLAAGDVVSGTIDFAIPAKDIAAALPPGDYTLACGHDFADSNTTNNRRDIVVTVKEARPPQECMEMDFSNSGEWLPCQDVPFLSQPVLQLVWHNPSMAVVGGFECGWDLAGSSTNYLTIFTIHFPIEAYALDIGLKDPLAGDYNIICGFGSPLPTSKATVLATIDVVFLESAPNDMIDLTLRNAIPPSFFGETRPIVASDTYELFPVELRHVAGSPSVQFNSTACLVQYVDEQPVKRVLNLFK